MRAAALALLALATVWPRWRVLQVHLAALGGALLVMSTWDASFRGRENGWAAVAGTGTALAVWWAAPRAHERLADFGAAWWMSLASVAAVYGCAPETGQMREVAIVVAAGGAAEFVLRRRLPTAALVAAAAFVEWSALFGAAGQGRALVGGLFALVPLVAVAIVPAGPRWRSLAVALVWMVAAVGMARTGGIATSLTPAVLAALAWAVGSALLTLVAVRLVRR
jgi:hypothetical protein